MESLAISVCVSVGRGGWTGVAKPGIHSPGLSDAAGGSLNQTEEMYGLYQSVSQSGRHDCVSPALIFPPAFPEYFYSQTLRFPSGGFYGGLRARRGKGSTRQLHPDVALNSCAPVSSETFSYGRRRGAELRAGALRLALSAAPEVGAGCRKCTCRVTSLVL